MTDKYKYGSRSFRKNILDNVEELSTNKVLLINGEKISSAKTFELGIEALKEKISSSERRTNGIANEKNQEA